MSAPPPQQSTGYRYRGLIWPGILIVIGAIALLVNTNILSSDRLYRLGDLWPLLLIVIGLELLVMRTPLPQTTAAIAAVVILLVAAVGTVAYVAAGPEVPTGTRTLDRSGQIGKIDQASLQVDVGAATLNITGADIGGDLFRAHIEYSGPSPSVSYDSSNGHIEISQGNGFHIFGPLRFVMNLKLNTSVRWVLAVHSGAATNTYDLSRLDLASLEDDTGASREEIKLGQPKGGVPVTINGGALTVHLHRPSETIAAVEVSGGAISLKFDGHQQHGVGSLSAGDTQSSDYFNVRINGGACTVTMDTGSG